MGVAIADLTIRPSPVKMFMAAELEPVCACCQFTEVDLKVDHLCFECREHNEAVLDFVKRAWPYLAKMRVAYSDDMELRLLLELGSELLGEVHDE